MITEVLAAVPSGDAGDANADGTRQVAGDEFIELFNPLDRPVSLRGMRLLDKDTIKKPEDAFIFPDVRLAPGQVCVVFNGHESAIPGPVGDTKAAAAANPNFGGALVFSARAPSSRRSLSNAGDFVLLTSADGIGLHMVRWGTLDAAAPSAKITDEGPINAKGSIARRTPGGAFMIHE
ncbi:MAG: lamin tail domain-containing protein, partial [Planctomyces sp.]